MMMIFMMMCSGVSLRCTVSVFFSDNEDVEGRVVDEDDD